MEIQEKSQLENDKRKSQIFGLQEKLTRANEKIIDIDTLKKKYVEKCKYLEKDLEEVYKENMVLKEKVGILQKEGLELRTAKQSNEKVLLEKIKQKEATISTISSTLENIQRDRQSQSSTLDMKSEISIACRENRFSKIQEWSEYQDIVKT